MINTYKSRGISNCSNLHKEINQQMVRLLNKRIQMQPEKIYSKYKLRKRKRIRPRKHCNRTALLLQLKVGRVLSHKKKMGPFSIWIASWILRQKHLSLQRGTHGRTTLLLAARIQEENPRSSALKLTQKILKPNSQSSRLKSTLPKMPKICTLISKIKIYPKL